MGRNSRIKKYRNKIFKKLEEMGLKNQTKLSPSGKTLNRVTYKMDENGKPVLNEQGEPVLTRSDFTHMQLSNPLKATLKKLLKEKESVIKQFLKQ